jgi:hypothetical protein
MIGGYFWLWQNAEDLKYTDQNIDYLKRIDPDEEGDGGRMLAHRLTTQENERRKNEDDRLKAYGMIVLGLTLAIVLVCHRLL